MHVTADARAKTSCLTATQEAKAAETAELIAFGEKLIEGFDFMPMLTKKCNEQKEFRIPFTKTPEGWEKLYGLYTLLVRKKALVTPVSLAVFQSEWKIHFPHVHFARVKNGFSECSFCYAYKQVVMAGAISDEAMKKWNKRFELHIRHCLDCRTRYLAAAMWRAKLVQCSTSASTFLPFLSFSFTTTPFSKALLLLTSASQPFER